mgnify:CR=1 FL=1
MPLPLALNDLLIKIQTADPSSKKTMRKTFNNGELGTILRATWTSYDLNESDLNKINTIKRLYQNNQSPLERRLFIQQQECGN